MNARRAIHQAALDEAKAMGKAERYDELKKLYDERITVCQLGHDVAELFASYEHD